MAVPVWEWPVDSPGGGSFKYVRSRIDLGGGIVNTVLHEVPFKAYDTTGQERSARLGTIEFRVKLNRKNYAGDAVFKDIQRFLIARAEAGDEAFYFYYRPEREGISPTIDTTGASTVGRYKVKCLSEISWTIEQLLFHDYAELIFQEDRS